MREYSDTSALAEIKDYSVTSILDRADGLTTFTVSSYDVTLSSSIIKIICRANAEFIP